MIRTPILHPDLLSAVAELGHGSQIVVADALFPHATGVIDPVRRVHLNVCPGMVPGASIVDLLGQTLHLEAAVYMIDPNAEQGRSSAVTEFADLLATHRHGGGQPIAWSGLDGFRFYEACRAHTVGLLIATGEVRPYANLLLTVGVP